jgi:hypothetical protein
VQFMRLSLKKAVYCGRIQRGIQEIRDAHHFRPRYAPAASRGRLANLGHPSCSYWLLR